MTISPGGALEAVFDPSTASVRLTVDGGMWPGPVDRVTVTRASPGAATVPVRTADGVPAAGGTWLGIDHEAPLDAPVTYTATGTHTLGGVVGSASVTVETVGAAWGVWLKAPGRADLTVRAPLRSASSIKRSTRDGIYQIIDGGAVGQSSGADTRTLSIVLQATDPALASRIRRVLDTSRQLLVQTGQPESFPSGYYQVTSDSEYDELQMRETEQVSLRRFTLTLERVDMPAGRGVPVTGTTYTSVVAGNATYQDLLDDHASYWDVLRGV